MRKRIAILFTVVILAICCCAAIAACGGVGKTVYANPEKYSVGGFTYSAADVEKVEINWVCGDITLVHSDRANLSVSEAGKNLKEEQQLHYLIENKTLKIQFWKSGHSEKNIREADKNLTVEVPNGIELNVKSVSGNVTDANLNAGSLKVESVSGGVSLTAISCQKIETETVSGDVRIRLSGKGATVEFKSVSGKYTGNRVIGDGAIEVDVETVSGNLTVE